MESFFNWPTAKAFYDHYNSLSNNTVRYEKLVGSNMHRQVYKEVNALMS